MSEHTGNQAGFLVRVEHLKKHFIITKGIVRRRTVTVKAVDDVSFDIRRGETLALVGESGCGKTTTGRCMIRAISPTAGRVVYSMDGGNPVDIASLDAPALKSIRREIRMVFQDPYASLNPRMTVFEIISEPMVIHRVHASRDALRARVVELMRMVRIDPAYLDRYPHAFSGGQRQRVAIARALALQPKLVIADEPVSALDVSVQAQILNLLKELQRKLALTYLFVAHNLAVVKYQADRVAIMYVGRIVELAETEALFVTPLHPYTEGLLAAAPNPEPASLTHRRRIVLAGDVANPADPPTGCHFHPRCPYAKEVCSVEVPALRAVGGGRLVACHFAGDLTLKGID